MVVDRIDQRRERIGSERRNGTQIHQQGRTMQAHVRDFVDLLQSAADPDTRNSPAEPESTSTSTVSTSAARLRRGVRCQSRRATSARSGSWPVELEATPIA